MKIRFLVDRVVKDHTKSVTAEFKAGREYEMNEFSAYHWITRNAAVEVTDKAGSAPETAEVKAPETAAMPKPMKRTPPMRG